MRDSSVSKVKEKEKEKKELVKEEFPEVIAAIENVEIAQKTADAVIRNMDYGRE